MNSELIPMVMCDRDICVVLCHAQQKAKMICNSNDQRLFLCSVFFFFCQFIFYVAFYFVYNCNVMKTIQHECLNKPELLKVSFSVYDMDR